MNEWEAVYSSVYRPSLWLLSAVGSLAVPSVPSASIVSILVVLSSLDVQVHNIGLLMALEWYNDRIRTTSNTMTIIVGAVVIDKLCKATLSASQESALETKIIDTEASIQVVNENGVTESAKL